MRPAQSVAPRKPDAEICVDANHTQTEIATVTHRLRPVSACALTARLSSNLLENFQSPLTARGHSWLAGLRVARSSLVLVRELPTVSMKTAQLFCAGSLCVLARPCHTAVSPCSKLQAMRGDAKQSGVHNVMVLG